MNIAKICKISDFLKELQKIKSNMEMEGYTEEAEMIEDVQKKFVERLNKLTGGQP
jgi:Xaa-Pro aminopeptidase